MSAIAGAVDYSICDQDNTGDEDIDLHATFDATVLNGQSAANFIITYHLSQEVRCRCRYQSTSSFTVITSSVQIFLSDWKMLPIQTVLIPLRVFRSFCILLPLFPFRLLLGSLRRRQRRFSGFDLTLADVGLYGRWPDLFVSYHATQLDAENRVLPLSSPYVNVNPYGDVVWARVASGEAAATRLSPSRWRSVTVLLRCPASASPDDAVADSFTEFDLTVVVPVVLAGWTRSSSTFGSTRTLGSAGRGWRRAGVAGLSQAISPGSYVNLSDPQTLWVLVVGNASSTSPNNGASGCYDIVPLELWVDPNPVDLGPFEYPLCDDGLNGNTLTDQVSTFDLTVVDPQATGGDPLLFVLWYESYADEAADLPIADRRPTRTPRTRRRSWAAWRTASAAVCWWPLPPRCSRTLAERFPVAPWGVRRRRRQDRLDLCFDGPRRGDHRGRAGRLGAVLPDPGRGRAGVRDGAFVPYTNTVPGGELVWAAWESDVPGVLPCYTVVGLQLVVVPLPAAPWRLLDPFFACDGDGDGLAGFDLEVQTPFVAGAGPPGFTVVTYHLSQADARSGSNPVDTSVPYVSGGARCSGRALAALPRAASVRRPSPGGRCAPVAGHGRDLYRCDDEVGAALRTTVSRPSTWRPTRALLDPGGSLSLSYYASASDQANGIAIGDPSAYRNEVSPQQEVFVTGTAPDGCPGYSSFWSWWSPTRRPRMQAPGLVRRGQRRFRELRPDAFDAGLANGEPVTVVGYYRRPPRGRGSRTELVSPHEHRDGCPDGLGARRTTSPGWTPATAWFGGAGRCPLPLRPTRPFSGTWPRATLTVTGLRPSTLRPTMPGAFGATVPGDLPRARLMLSRAWARSTRHVARERQGHCLGPCCRGPLRAVPAWRPSPVGWAAAELGPGPSCRCLRRRGGGSSPTTGLDLQPDAERGRDPPGGASGYQVSYYASQAAQDAGDAIADPTSYQNTSNPDVVYVSVFGTRARSARSCPWRLSRTPPTDPGTYAVCDGVPEGDLDPTTAFRSSTCTGAGRADRRRGPGVTVEYYASEAGGRCRGGGHGASLALRERGGMVPGGLGACDQGSPSVLACHSVLAVSLEVSPLRLWAVRRRTLWSARWQRRLRSSTYGQRLGGTGRPGPLAVPGTVLPFGPPTPWRGGPGGVAGAFATTSNPQQLWAGILSVAGATPAPVDPVTGRWLALPSRWRSGGCPGLCPAPAGGLRQPRAVLWRGGGLRPFGGSLVADAPGAGVLGGQDPSVYAVGFGTQADAEAGTGALPSVYANLRTPGGVGPGDQYLWRRWRAWLLGGGAGGALGGLSAPVLLGGTACAWTPRGPAGGGVPVRPRPRCSTPGSPRRAMPSRGRWAGRCCPTRCRPRWWPWGTPTRWRSPSSRRAARPWPWPRWRSPRPAGALRRGGERCLRGRARGGGRGHLGPWAVGVLDRRGPFQDSGTFPGVPRGHLVEISDALGCGSVQVPVFVVDYPALWRPTGTAATTPGRWRGSTGLDPSARVYVFDRYGKLLRNWPLGARVDGTFNGAPVPRTTTGSGSSTTRTGRHDNLPGTFTLKR